MNAQAVRFEFGPGASVLDAEATLRLSILAAEGLFGESAVRTDVSYAVDDGRNAIVVDGTTPAGDAVVRIFTAFLIKEFGSGGFAVRRVSSGDESIARAGTAVQT